MAKPNGLLMIDNYDSFTYNLVQYFGELKAKPIVFRNNEITVEKVKKLNPRQIVISPGPGRPEDAGVTLDLIKRYAGKIPIYGTSQIYSGTPNPKADRDLNGIRFTAMPWLFDDQSPEKIAIAKASSSAAVYGRLHALGVDAYRIYARLPQMAKTPDIKINGATGSLHLANNGRIEREQLWVRFSEGSALPLPMVVENPMFAEDDNE